MRKKSGKGQRAKGKGHGPQATGRGKKVSGPTSQVPGPSSPIPHPASLTLWEVFTQPPGGGPHEHAGSVHAADAEQALQNARDVYSRRGEAVSLWVVPSSAITASTPDDMGPFFDPGNDKPYRHPQFYKVPLGVRGV